MAEYTYDVLEKYGPAAVEDNRHHKITKTLEDYLIDSPYVDPSPESLILLHEAMKQMQ